ncbi:Methyltransferase domain-containing protein [Lentzea albidocapillata subsp. violacea]|uniref:Methyltransferase domain-containing protein n=1 Tax=Lentzea albidocapillata subsp. violacea TaxID=128104 RepID=A0A1G9IY12_9PSEU|nr:class I SAM-dependent methyltransferase [Lentzea albidocapillata]SDL30100.1 Methyltransferase domain-containing protein [Lentzea albidocapillata subsp. violacea]
MTFAPEWLALREIADADARSEELADVVRETLVNRNPLTIRDLGCGTGSMGRWLAGRLGGVQHWVLHDRDPRLLGLAVAGMNELENVTAETREGDLTSLKAADIEGADLVTCSALLDLLTTNEMNALAVACVEAHVPALFTLSVAGRIDIDPAEPLDAAFQDAFNAHQRRVVDGRRLLGPDAPAVAEEAFVAAGASVRTAQSPWRMNGDALQREWLKGWVDAAVEQEPTLAAEAPEYLRRRSTASVTVHHVDLLALPGAV